MKKYVKERSQYCDGENADCLRQRQDTELSLEVSEKGFRVGQQGIDGA